jgi:hypothetical protein
MGKIYEGENKLNVLQVCDKLRNEINTEQAKVLAGNIVLDGVSNKRKFAHMVLDAYKQMPNTTEHDMMIKKLAKHLMEKYMKSSTTIEGEDSAFKILIDDIVKKAGE